MHFLHSPWPPSRRFLYECFVEPIKHFISSFLRALCVVEKQPYIIRQILFYNNNITYIYTQQTICFPKKSFFFTSVLSIAIFLSVHRSNVICNCLVINVVNYSETYNNWILVYDFTIVFNLIETLSFHDILSGENILHPEYMAGIKEVLTRPSSSKIQS
jgi:hypothetical protein